MDTRLPSGTPAHVGHGDGAERGLVVIPDIWGLRPLFSDLCDDLAERTGWSVASFDPFAGVEMPGADDPDGFDRRVGALRGLDDESLLADAVAAAGATGCDRVGLVGFCMGGMYALKASSTGRFGRIASFYGMIRVPADWEGPGQGQPLEHLADRGSTEVMAVVGTEDEWTPPGDVAELERAGVEVVRYEGAGHGFVHDPSRPAHRREDAEDAWRRVLAFLAG